MTKGQVLLLTITAVGRYKNMRVNKIERTEEKYLQYLFTDKSNFLMDNLVEITTNKNRNIGKFIKIITNHPGKINPSLEQIL